MRRYHPINKKAETRCRPILAMAALCLGLFTAVPLSAAKNGPAQLQATEEFNGPFASWKNLKTDFGAKGDGVADDTAALKAALEALPEHGEVKPEDSLVLFLPAGTYRITEPLVWINRLGVAVIGEDPATTIIRYDGPAGKTMLTCHGVSYSKFGRITWDGQGKAGAAVAHKWDPITIVGPAVTYMEHADSVFMDVGMGLIGGTSVPDVNENGNLKGYGHGMDAEFIVKRSKFLRCSEAGLSIDSFNALDWWVWDSEFVDCAVGATNSADGLYGGGHFHIYRSNFRQSKIADIRTGHTNYFGFRFNTSIGSRRFLEAIRPSGFSTPGIEHPTIKIWGKWEDEERYGSMQAVQGNRILNPTDPTPVWINQHGPLLLLDNTFVVKPEGDSPLVSVSPPTDGASCISIGNKFYGADRFEVKGELIEFDNETLPWDSADQTIPAPAPFAPYVQRQIFQISRGAGGEVIQKAIDEAAKLTGKKPVIHLPAGRYNIHQTLRIPANSDLQIIGDGHNTILIWEGDEEGTMMHVAGPSRATLRDFRIIGIENSKKQALGRGIVAENIDQPGSQILLDQVNAHSCRRSGIIFDGLAHARVEAIGSGGGSNQGPGLTVVGAGENTSAWVGFFGSAGSNNRMTHVVKNHGRLVVWDTWYETSASKKDAEPRYIHLTDHGYLTFFNGHIATFPSGEANANLFAIDIDGFVGNFTMIGGQLNTRNPQIRLAGEGKGMQVLVLGTDFAPPDPWLDNQTQAGKLSAWSNRRAQEPLPAMGTREPEFLREMLKDARNVVPTAWAPAPAGATDLRLYRVEVTYEVGQGFVFEGSSAASNQQKEGQ